MSNDASGMRPWGRAVIQLAVDDWLLEQLFTFDAAAEDLEESNDAEADDDANIAKLTTEIVAAYISHHQLRVPEVPDVINAVRG